MTLADRPYNKVKKNSRNHIDYFLKIDYQSYAVYKVHQRLPHLVDGLAQTQRKIIHVLHNSTKKIKTAEIYSLIYSRTKYLHGDASAYRTSESLSRSASNNINLLTEEGNFGFRTNREPAGPRYTNTRLSSIAREKIFRLQDKNIFTNQEFEGTQIEPKFLLPVVPPVIFNGIEAIAVGYSCNIQPRDPIKVIDACLDTLNNLEPQEPPLSYPYYTGDVLRITTAGKNSWLVKGRLNRTGRKNAIEITEVPPNYTREIYIKKLKKMQENNIIRSFTEACIKNSFYFKVILPPEMVQLTDDDLLDKLQLCTKITENITFINPVHGLEIVDTIHRFNSMTEYIKVFIELRAQWYQKRKDQLILEYTKEIKKLNNRIRFIDKVNLGEITITNQKKKELELILLDLEFDKENDNYDYLLGMKLWNLTDEIKIKYVNSIEEKQQALKTIRETSVKETHIKELMSLRAEILK